jgi:Holliday junction resolvase RusA-like endonuclease
MTSASAQRTGTSPETPALTLPWPDKRLSSNARVHFIARSRITRAHKAWAITLAQAHPQAFPAHGDIGLRVTFHPPSRRIDRQNMPHLVKAYIDGLALGWRINDRRFLPEYAYAEPVRGGRVVFEVGCAVAGFR